MLFRRVLLLLVATLLLATTTTFINDARADDWAAPDPVGFHGRGFQYVAEIFPPKSRQNTTGTKPLCFFYEIPYGKNVPPLGARVVWKGPLVNKEMPYEAIVSMDGRLVTLDDYANLGFENAVAIYKPDGTHVRSLKLEEIITTPADLAAVDRSISSRYWRKGARYFFLTKPTHPTAPARLYIVLASKKAAEISLDNATAPVRFQDSATFPDLAPLLSKGGANEETEIWQVNLRFSSITDAKLAAAPSGSVALPPTSATTTTTTTTPTTSTTPSSVPTADPGPPKSSCSGCIIGTQTSEGGVVGMVGLLSLTLFVRRRRS